MSTAPPPGTGLALATHRWWHSSPRVAMLAVAALGDAVNFASALGELMQDQAEYVLWAVVGALTVAAVGLMHFAGLSAHRALSSGGRWFGWPATALGLVWLLLGLSLLGLRAQAEDGSSAPAAASFGVPGAAAAGGEHTLWLPLMMFALFVATGAMAAYAAFDGHHPDRSALRRLERTRKRAARRHRRAGVRLVLVQGQLEQQREDRLRDGERHDAALQACDAWAQELKEQVRVRMAVAVGDPAGTSGLTDQAAPR